MVGLVCPNMALPIILKGAYLIGHCNLGGIIKPFE